MKNSIYFLAALVILAACRESNLGTPSAPTANAARVLRYDTTFINIAQRTRAYRYVTDLRVGKKAQMTVPVEINWTSTMQAGCPQVSSVQVYQLNGGDRRTNITATAVRQATCLTGLGPDGKLSTATTGTVVVSIAGQLKDAQLHPTSCLLNGLGYHDSLSYANAADRR